MAPPIRSKSLQALHDHVVTGDPEMAAEIDRGYEDLKIGVALSTLRTDAGLSTRALAKLVGTQPSVISRIEHANYQSHSVSMLRRVAAALGHRVVVTFEPVEASASPTPSASGKKPKPRRARAVGRR